MTIFWKNEKGGTSFMGGPTEGGGFHFFYGHQCIFLTREDCVRLVMILSAWLTATEGGNAKDCD